MSRSRFQIQITFALLIFLTAFVQGQEVSPEPKSERSDYLNPKTVPPQPPEETRYFIEDLKSPLWIRHPWKSPIANDHEADLSHGVIIRKGFKDEKRRLESAYRDLAEFLEAGDVAISNGGYIIETGYVAGLQDEAFHIDVRENSCRILASSANGIRRGIFFIEDEMLKRRGAILPLGYTKHFPVVKRRIIRGYFSPTKRPTNLARKSNQPLVIDELMNDEDYYPEEYLNRLAHQGVNGLWLSLSGNNSKGEMVGFGDLVSTSITPHEGVDGEQRFAKLKKVVEKCLRYGIRTYLFAIEPSVRLSKDNPIFQRYPEAEVIGDMKLRNLCVSSEPGRQYLYEATKKIFSEIPELGGLINISHGERYTTCLSSLSATGQGKIVCPRCSAIAPWEILDHSLSAMEKGIHEASPDAELISWLYMPQPQSQSSISVDTLAGWVYDIPAHTPKGVILQFNFTSGVERMTFDKKLIGGDYWLIPAGPSPRYERIADVAKERGTQLSAKIQTATSHEVTTVPYVPVPSALYKKFEAMRRENVQHTMLSWYFGNAPGLMVKAVDLLSFDSSRTENEFLHQLAAIYWKKKDVPKVIEAWKYFEDGYSYYPLTNRFQYYGPMHDGPVWPLLLKPLDAPLSPTWLLGSAVTRQPWPPSGDRIGDSFTELLTLEEVLNLSRKMSEEWDRGVAILNELESRYSHEPERILDIGVAKALGIQLKSGYHILQFYFLREKMLRMNGTARLDILKQMKAIVYQELALDEELLLLCSRDSRLGYHPEAEGYKYYPAKIRWRMKQLRTLLQYDFPLVERMIQEGQLLFPEYTGMNPTGLTAPMVPGHNLEIGNANSKMKLPEALTWQSFNFGDSPYSFQWAACYDKEGIYVLVKTAKGKSGNITALSVMTIRLQPRRLWPVKQLNYDPPNSATKKIFSVVRSGNESFAVAKVLWEDLGADRDKERIRIDIRLTTNDGKWAGWCDLKPVTPRLELGANNPNDLGWLLITEK